MVENDEIWKKEKRLSGLYFGLGVLWGGGIVGELWWGWIVCEDVVCWWDFWDFD